MIISKCFLQLFTQNCYTFSEIFHKHEKRENISSVHWMFHWSICSPVKSKLENIVYKIVRDICQPPTEVHEMGLAPAFQMENYLNWANLFITQKSWTIKMFSPPINIYIYIVCMYWLTILWYSLVIISYLTNQVLYVTNTVIECHCGIWLFCFGCPFWMSWVEEMISYNLYYFFCLK